ncbi:hypothetical protein [Sphingomonas sp. Leaf4]|uniref:hypothetical protein n=1 Tax=Sphingomonas sp. Leaf4 TaxID=2876553 RepID=UPI001E2C607A|nr:hypothetical protein [Sphingomonas sp. Leaf4]
MSINFLLVHPAMRLARIISGVGLVFYFIYLIWSGQSAGYWTSSVMLLLTLWSVAADRAKIAMARDNTGAGS